MRDLDIFPAPPRHAADVKPRIAMLSIHTCPLAALGGKETGGMNVYVRELSRELARRGYEVDVFTRSQSPTIPRVNEDGLGPGARIIHVPAGPEKPYNKNQVWNHLPEFVDGVKAFACREGVTYDLFHSHYWLSGWVARELQREWPAPIIHMFHTLGRMKNQVARTAAHREIEQRITVETQIMDFADRVVAATPRDKQQMVKLYDADATNIDIVPCGVDPRMFHPIPTDEAKEHLGIALEDHFVLFVGRMDPLKGLDTLVRGIAHVLDEEPGLRHKMCMCVIGGDVSDDLSAADEEVQRMDRLREELGIEDVVTFLGAQPQDKLPYYYSAADVVVVPSHYESFGMVALEALACGTPVIASDVGGLSFIVEDRVTGFLVPEKNPTALAEKLRCLLAHGDLREEMGRQAVARARDYYWPAVTDQIEALYEEVICTTLTTC